MPTGSDESPTDSQESTATTESTTTEVTTTKPEETTTEESSTTESTINETTDTEYDVDDDVSVANRNVKESDDEILNANKKRIRLLSEYYNIDGIDIMNIINETINEYYSLNNVSILNKTISISSEDNNKTLNIIVLLMIENKYNEIAVILEENINTNKNTTFYNILSNKSNNLYSFCSIDNNTDISTTTIPTTTTTTTIPTITECKYPSKSIFMYGSGIKMISNNNSLSNNDISITYSSSSRDCNIDKNTGNITIDTNKQTTDGYIKCIITCSYENIKDEKAIIQYKITSYKPSVDVLLSSFPYIIYENEKFDIKLTLVYPFISDLMIDEQQQLQSDMNMSLNIESDNNKYILQNSPIYLTSKTVFEYNNLIITNSTDETLKEVKNNEEEDENDENDDNKEDKITFNFLNESTKIYTSDEITVIGMKHSEKCKKDERDEMGLCCLDNKDKECINGIMCKNLTFIIPFINEIDIKLYETYYRLFDEVIFNNTNYLWYSYIEESNKKLIITKINILKKYSNRMLLLLKEEVKENNELTFKNYDYIKSVLSILECTDEIEMEEKINVLPSNIKDIIINSKMDEKMKSSIKEINKINEETMNGIDYDIGVSCVFNYKSEESKEEKEKDPWYKEYIYLVVVVGIIILLILVVILSFILAYIGQKIEERKMKKNEVIFQQQQQQHQNVIPIEKINENNNNNLTYIGNNNGKIIMEGYLMKENVDRVYNKYERRYCVLYNNPDILRIYGSMSVSYYGKVYLDEKQSIPLECYNGIEYEEGSNEFTLKLKIRESYLMTYEPGDKEIKMKFGIDEEIENSSLMIKEWVEKIKKLKNERPIVVSEAWTKPSVMNERESENRLSSTSRSEYYEPETLEKAKNRKGYVEGGRSIRNKREVKIQSN